MGVLRKFLEILTLLSFIAVTSIMVSSHFILMKLTGDSPSERNDQRIRIITYGKDALSDNKNIEDTMNEKSMIMDTSSRIKPIVGQHPLLVGPEIQNETGSIATFEELEEESINLPHSTTNAATRTKASLDMFHHQKGGMVLLYHVAKTGGTSIQQLFVSMKKQKSSKRKYVYQKLGYKNRHVKIAFDDEEARDGQIRKIDDHIRGKNSKTLLLEVHSSHYGGLHNNSMLSSKIRNWREMSQTYNTPMFVITVLREPFSFAKSYFRYFHVNCNKKWCPEQFNITLEDFVQTLEIHPNHQCHMLITEKIFRPRRNGEIDIPFENEEECEAIYETMKSTVDYVGTTDALTSELEPLLYHMLNGIVEEKHNLKSEKNLPFEEASTIDDTTMARIEDLSKYDQKIYDKVKRDFVLSDHFPDFKLKKKKR